MKRLVFFLSVSMTGILSVNGFAQIGGDATYQFINLPFSARTASLGGNLISVKDDTAVTPFSPGTHAYVKRTLAQNFFL